MTMKRKFIIAILFVVTCIFSACSSQGISQEEYDKIIAERDSIQNDYAKLSSDYDELKKKYTEELNQKLTNLNDNLPLQSAEAWAETSFKGSKSACAIMDDILFVSVLTDSEISQETSNQYWNEFISAMKIYNVTASMTPDMFPCKYISVMFYDKNKTGIFQTTMDIETSTITDLVFNGIHLTEIMNGMHSE